MLAIEKLSPSIPSSKLDELRNVIDIILKCGKPELIILFGSFARGDFKPDYHEDQPRKSDFDILIITENSTEKQRISKNIDVNLFAEIATPVQFFIETIDRVNDKLEDEHYFFTDVVNEGIHIYDTGKLKLSEARIFSPRERREQAEKDFNDTYSSAISCMERFNETYPNAKTMVKLKWCAFDLQQSAELCYKTIEMVFTHYMQYEHKLVLLRETATKFDSRSALAFKLETQEEKDLFRYLDYAYIGGRYTAMDEYPVTVEQIEYWKIEAEKLLKLTHAICTEKIEALKLQESNS